MISGGKSSVWNDVTLSLEQWRLLFKSLLVQVLTHSSQCLDAQFKIIFCTKALLQAPNDRGEALREQDLGFPCQQQCVSAGLSFGWCKDAESLHGRFRDSSGFRSHWTNTFYHTTTVPCSVFLPPLLLIKKEIWLEVFQVSCCSCCWQHLWFYS